MDGACLGRVIAVTDSSRLVLKWGYTVPPLA